MEKRIKETIITISLGLLVIFVIINRDKFIDTDKEWLLFTAMGISLIGISWSWLSKVIHKGWFLLADKMGYVMSRVILSIVFIVLVIPFGLIGAVLGGMAPRMYMKRQQNKRITTFGNQLPDMLNLTVNGLRAGYSTLQALESVSKELPPPLSE